MKISHNWLKNYLQTNLSAEELGEILTDIGLELEGLESIQSIKGGLKGIVVGEVLTCAKHPNADKLSVTTVDILGERPLQIVCGAPNVAAGQKVLVATEGAEVYGKVGSSFVIKKGNIRSEVSEGMICAEDELGLGSSHEGIMVLPNEAKKGMSAAEYFNVKTDHVFEIGLTPNRSDATNHIGVARDLNAAINFRDLGDAVLKLPEMLELNICKSHYPVTVDLVNATDCPRYSGLIIENINVGESPDWLKEYLIAIDQRPINNVVDITNFVLHETGQPLHAFDLDKISGNTIIIKNLKEGTSFTTLDGVERKLLGNDLMICDGNSAPMCIAGVFGGKDSGVTESTSSIFIESAYFKAKPIRKTSTKHLLRTDASKCFEKGSDPEATVRALQRAAYLFQEIMGAKPANEILDIYPQVVERQNIEVHYKRINELIGVEISPEKVKRILFLLEMNIVFEEKEKLTITVPTNKADVIREVDVIEEIFRIYGLNEVPIDERLSYSYNSSIHPDPIVVKSDISKMLATIGFQEIMSVSLTQSSYFETAIPFPKEELVFINNTGNIHLDVMRPTMIVSGLEALLYNLNRQQHNQQNQYRLFEFGRIYAKEEGKIVEQDQLAIFMTGNRWPESWANSDKTKLNFADMKSYVEMLLQRFGLKNCQQVETKDSYFAEAIEWRRGQQLFATAGKLKASVCKKMDVKQEVWVAIFNWKQLESLLAKQTVHVTELNRFPSVKRDLALIVEKSTKFSDIAKIVNKVAKPLLTDLNLFDVYENDKQLGEGKKSYAVSFIFEQSDGTLKDEEVDNLMLKLRKSFTDQLGALIRQ